MTTKRRQYKSEAGTVTSSVSVINAWVNLPTGVSLSLTKAESLANALLRAVADIRSDQHNN